MSSIKMIAEEEARGRGKKVYEEIKAQLGIERGGQLPIFTS